MRFIVSATTSNDWPFTRSSARFTTPGPLTPTFITQSPSPGPWNAPAMNGLSSTALENMTSLAHASPPRSAVRSALNLTARPHSATASMSMPALVEATLTLAHTRSVVDSASGSDSISRRSDSVMPFCTSAE